MLFLAFYHHESNIFTLNFQCQVHIKHWLLNAIIISMQKFGDASKPIAKVKSFVLLFCCNQIDMFMLQCVLYILERVWSFGMLLLLHLAFRCFFGFIVLLHASFKYIFCIWFCFHFILIRSYNWNDVCQR